MPGSELMKTSTGLFGGGTTKQTTKSLNMYDTSSSHFHPLPDGPFESGGVRDQPTAQEHFNATREIKLVERMKSDHPLTSHIDHYPPKELPGPADVLHAPAGTMPFTARTEYDDQFFGKPRAPRPMGPLQYEHKMRPFVTLQTTNQDTYRPWRIEQEPAGSSRGGTPKVAGAMPPLPVDYNTTYRSQYTPKDPPGRAPQGTPDPKEPMPWLAGDTTYGEQFVPKQLALQPVLDDFPAGTVPFNGETEYQGQFTAKPLPEHMLPLTGIVAKEGLQLPLPRRSLGVEFWHKGVTNKFFLLIPRSTPVPCAARQVFTTVHDNQSEACILVQYGDDPVASNNLLLGQFDIVNIPPAPKDVPRIEVIFRLDAEMLLTVEARDLDTQRHKLWLQRAEQVRVLKA